MRNLLVYIAILFSLYLIVSTNLTESTPIAPTGEIDVTDLGDDRLVPPSRRDEQIRVATGQISSSTGTAFALGNGNWLSARHVVENCDRIYIISGNQNWSAKRSEGQVKISPHSDLALITADQQQPAFTFGGAAQINQNQSGFLVGFPQGRTGEVRARLIGRGRASFANRRSNSEPVLVWVETGRSAGFSGTIGGISGGPIFDPHGKVIGVAIAETLRRGRVYTAAPRSIHRSLVRWDKVPTDSQQAGIFSKDNYTEQGDYLRQTGRVVKVLCMVD